MQRAPLQAQVGRGVYSCAGSRAATASCTAELYCASRGSMSSSAQRGGPRCGVNIVQEADLPGAHRSSRALHESAHAPQRLILYRRRALHKRPVPFRAHLEFIPCLPHQHGLCLRLRLRRGPKRLELSRGRCVRWCGRSGRRLLVGCWGWSRPGRFRMVSVGGSRVYRRQLRRLRQRPWQRLRVGRQRLSSPRVRRVSRPR